MNRKSKSVIYVSLFENKVGGLNKWINDTNEVFLDKGFKTRFINLYGETNNSNCITICNKDYENKNRMVFDLLTRSKSKFESKLEKYFSDFENNIIIITHPLLSRFILNSKLHNKNNVVCMQFHSDKKNCFESNSPYSIIHRYGIKKYIKKFDYFTTFTKFEKDYMQSLGYNNLAIFGNGIKMDYVQREQKSRKILYLSRLDKGKNVDKIIYTLSSIYHELENNDYVAEVYIAHNRSDKKQHLNYNKLVDHITNLGREDRIKINPGIYGKDKIEVLKQCSIGLMYSDFEGLPITILEFINYGLVTVTNLSTQNLYDVIENNETSYIVDNWDQFKTQLLTLIKDDKLVEKISNKQLVNAKNYRVEKYVDLFLEEINLADWK